MVSLLQKRESLGRQRVRRGLWDNHGCEAINQNVAKRSHKCARAILDSGCTTFFKWLISCILQAPRTT